MSLAVQTIPSSIVLASSAVVVLAMSSSVTCPIASIVTDIASIATATTYVVILSTNRSKCFQVFSPSLIFLRKTTSWYAFALTIFFKKSCWIGDSVKKACWSIIFLILKLFFILLFFRSFLAILVWLQFATLVKFLLKFLLQISIGIFLIVSDLASWLLLFSWRCVLCVLNFQTMLHWLVFIWLDYCRVNNFDIFFWLCL